MCPPIEDAPPPAGGAGRGQPPGIEAALVRDVVAHARTQLNKGWTPREVVTNLKARYGLTPTSAQRLVGVLVFRRRAGTTPEQMAAELSSQVELPFEEAARVVGDLLADRVDPEEPATIQIDVDPERAGHFIPAAQPAHPPVTQYPGEPRRRYRPPGPIKIEINLLPDRDD